MVVVNCTEVVHSVEVGAGSNAKKVVQNVEVKGGNVSVAVICEKEPEGVVDMFAFGLGYVAFVAIRKAIRTARDIFYLMNLKSRHELVTYQCEVTMLRSKGYLSNVLQMM